MILHEIRDIEGANRKKKRVARGPGRADRMMAAQLLGSGLVGTPTTAERP